MNGASRISYTTWWGIARTLILRTAISISISLGLAALNTISLKAQQSLLNPFTGRFDFIAPPGHPWGALVATRCLRTDAAGAFVSAVADCGAGGVNYQTVQDEGVPLAQEPVLNIIGAMVVCADNPGVSTDCTWANPAAYATIQDEGVPLAQEATLNFIGAGVTCVDNAGVSTDCTIPGGGGFNPLTTSFEDEEFCGGTTVSQTAGKLGWGQTGGTYTRAAAIAGRPCVHLLRANNNTIAIFLQSWNVGGIDYADMWSELMMVSPQQVDADTVIRFGVQSTVAAAPANPPTNGVYLERLGGDATWFLVTNDGFGQTRTNTGVAAAVGWLRVVLRRVNAATVGVSLNGGAETPAILNIPLGNGAPFFQLQSTIAANKELYIDYWSMTITGLAR